MLRITDSLTIPDDAVRVRFIRARGPGGQHVNKASTGVEVRLAAAALGPAVVRRLAIRYPAQVTADGEVVVASDSHRSQVQNRREAEARLIAMVRACLLPRRRRKATRVPVRSRRARLVAKRRRSETKQRRRGPTNDEG